MAHDHAATWPALDGAGLFVFEALVAQIAKWCSNFKSATAHKKMDAQKHVHFNIWGCTYFRVKYQ